MQEIESLGECPTQRMKVADLLKYVAKYNPRVISDEALQGLEESLSSYGVVQPVVFNARTSTVVGGHQRLKVLDRKQVEYTDVRIVDLDELHEKTLNIVLNNPNIEGAFDELKLQDLLSEIKDADETLLKAMRLEALDMPSWENVKLPEKANHELLADIKVSRISVSIPADKNFIVDELISEIERLVSENFDGNGISVKKA